MTAAEFQSSGLLYLANRTLHPFGVALAVTFDTDAGTVDEAAGLTIATTDDPAGFTFDETTENECRRRLAAWLRENWKP